MLSRFYEGSVSMKPEMEKVNFIGDDDASYRMPEVFFACDGETGYSQEAFDWHGDSVIVVSEECIVKYTEYNTHEVLVTDSEGKKIWMEGRAADVLGWNAEDVEEVRKVKQYFIEEYDTVKSKKRKYKVSLEETSEITEWDQYYFGKVIDGENAKERPKYVLRDTY